MVFKLNFYGILYYFHESYVLFIIIIDFKTLDYYDTAYIINFLINLFYCLVNFLKGTWVKKYELIVDNSFKGATTHKISI